MVMIGGAKTEVVFDLTLGKQTPIKMGTWKIPIGT